MWDEVIPLFFGLLDPSRGQPSPQCFAPEDAATGGWSGLVAKAPDPTPPGAHVGGECLDASHGERFAPSAFGFDMM